MNKHRKLNYNKLDELLLALEHEECDSDCKQPCLINKKLREGASDMLERIEAENKQLREVADVLRELVALKDLKDKSGKTQRLG